MSISQFPERVLTTPSDIQEEAAILGAFVLAGGKGSRLKQSYDPELQELPKVLVPIWHKNRYKPLIDVVLGGLMRHGFENVSLLTSADVDAQADKVEAHVTTQFAEKTSHLQVIREESPLGTAGATHQAFWQTPCEVASIIPSDILFPFGKLRKIFRQHAESNAGITWVVTTNPGEAAQNTGKLLVDSEGRLIEAIETDDDSDRQHRTSGFPVTSAGVVIASRSFFLGAFSEFSSDQQVSGESPVDMYRQFIPWVVQQGMPVQTFDVKRPVPDLGTPDRIAPHRNINKEVFHDPVT